MSSSRAVFVGGLVVGVVAAAIGLYALFAGAYTVKVALPASSPNLREGMPIYLNGFDAGEVEDISAADNQAIVTISVDGARAPLHSGAFARVKWKSVFGERVLELVDGPPANPEIPSGGLLKGEFPKPQEVGDVLAAFDPATRNSLASLVGRLQETVKGKEGDLNKTLNTMGPALEGVGQVLRGVGTDGAAITAMVTDLNNLLATVDRRNPDVQAVVNQLSRTTEAVARQHDDLRTGLGKMPDTLRQARTTLGQVPPTTEETLPLLADLEAATSHLPSVSAKLAPVLKDLRPTVEDLRPTLESASVLLDRTPDVLDTAHGTLPGINTAAREYLTPLDSLRPYTPDLVGWLTGWGSASQNYDANGRYARILLQQGGSSFNANPGVMPPGITREERPPPGAAGNNIVPLGADGEGIN